MTVEVLGTVLGTAIQGQIVGQANMPCLEDPKDSAVATEDANHTHSTTSLRETVRPLSGQGFGEMRNNGVVCNHPQNSNIVAKCWTFGMQTINVAMATL